MFVKLDEQLSQLLKTPVEDAGYEVSTVYDQNLTGASDQELWRIIQEEGAFFATADKEFANIQKYPPSSHYGVLLFRPSYESLYSYRRFMLFVLNSYNLEELKGKTVVVNEAGIRIRS